MKKHKWKNYKIEKLKNGIYHVWRQLDYIKEDRYYKQHTKIYCPCCGNKGSIYFEFIKNSNKSLRKYICFDCYREFSTFPITKKRDFMEYKRITLFAAALDELTTKGSAI